MAKEYIEREAFMEFWNKEFRHLYPNDKYLVALANFPTADVVEVVHGEWIEHEWAEEENGLIISNFECSACHNWKRKRSDYCPNCGAKMDGKGDAE